MSAMLEGADQVSAGRPVHLAGHRSGHGQSSLLWTPNPWGLEFIYRV